MRYMNFNDLRNQQNACIQQTYGGMPGISEHVGIGVSALLAFLYETGKLADLKTEPGVVQSYAWLWVNKSVYTIVASLTCAESGFYAESLSLNRSLSEALVQILYLIKHPAAVAQLPNTANGRKRKLSFRKMFEEVAPGYYDTAYFLSSEFIHPGLEGNVYKLQRGKDGQGQIDQGIVFKSDPLTHCFNELSMLILGLLRSFRLVYPTLALKPDTLAQCELAMESLQKVIDSHIELKGGKNDWHRLSEHLWNPS